MTAALTYGETSAPGDFTPNYFLSQAELGAIERKMLSYTLDRQQHNGVHALLIEPWHEFSNYVRTQEENTFPGASAELSLEAERDTKQLALVDTRPRSAAFGRTTFAGTISGFRPKGSENQATTGVAAVDELIDIPENRLDAGQFRDYCERNDIDPDSVIGIETAIKLVPGVRRYHLLRTAQLAYAAIFKIVRSMNSEERIAPKGFAAVARVNGASQASYARLGVSAEPLMGRTDWVTPEDRSDSGQYTPIFIAAKHNPVLGLIKHFGPQIIDVE